MHDDHYLPRPDEKTAAQVNNGILIQHASGTLIAANYLYRKGVPFNVALRVLSRPWRRRGGNDVLVEQAGAGQQAMRQSPAQARAAI